MKCWRTELGCSASNVSWQELRHNSCTNICSHSGGLYFTSTPCNHTLVLSLSLTVTSIIIYDTFASIKTNYLSCVLFAKMLLSAGFSSVFTSWLKRCCIISFNTENCALIIISASIFLPKALKAKWMWNKATLYCTEAKLPQTHTEACTHDPDILFHVLWTKMCFTEDRSKQLTRSIIW